MCLGVSACSRERRGGVWSGGLGAPAGDASAAGAAAQHGGLCRQGAHLVPAQQVCRTQARWLALTTREQSLVEVHPKSLCQSADTCNSLNFLTSPIGFRRKSVICNHG